MIIKRIFLSSIICFILLSCSKNKSATNRNEVLWYPYSAKYWNSQALHIGNGYFGASFFGDTDEEVFTLSEASMWTGKPANGNWERAGVNPKAKESMPIIREAVLNNQAQLADSLITQNVFGSYDYFGNFTAVGELKLKFHNQKDEINDYRRSLNLAKSLGDIQYSSGKRDFMREYFCSYPDKILAIKLSSDVPGSISLDLSIDVAQDSSIVTITNNQYEVQGFIDGNLRPFHLLLHVKNQGGEIEESGESLILRDADEVEIYLTMATNYKMEYPWYIGEEPRKVNLEVMDRALSKSYEQLKSNHVQDYQELYDRVKLDLHGDDEIEKLPTNERFQRLRDGKSDVGYKELAFNLGRYMIISSSRPKTLPANLQGVWNAFKKPPWAGNYQSNINLQEIYWSCGPTNLPECQQSYIDWIDDLVNSGKEVAKRVYGTNGWVSHTTGNIWGHAAPIGGHPWAMYPMGAAWHCQHVWDQFAFTQDKVFLNDQAYPIMKEASVFWLENLVSFGDYFITAPTVSAEHGALMTESGLNPAFHDLKSDKYYYSLKGAYQDVEMIWDLFTNTSEASIILGDDEFAQKLLNARERLLPLKIGKYGQLQEWYEDIDEPECHHRHIAHLYAVCPGGQINPIATPDLANAAKKSLDMRGDGRFMEQELASGGNWARAHRMWCWARLLDGNRADKILTEMLTEQGFENGLTFQHAEYHMNRPDFYMEDGLYLHYQLDGSASVPGLIAEMVLQSHLGELHILPALPDEFSSGKIIGLIARGGYSIDIFWEKGELTKAIIRVPEERDIPVIRIKSQLISDLSNDQIEIIKL